MMHEIIEPLTQKQFRTFDGLDAMRSSIKDISLKYDEVLSNVTRVVEKNEIYHDVQQYCRQLEDEVIESRNLLKADIHNMDQKLETWGARWRATQADVNTITRVEDKVQQIQRQIGDIMERQKDTITQKINSVYEDLVKQSSDIEKKYRSVFKELQDVNVKVMSMRDSTQQYDIRFKKLENSHNDIKETLDNQRFTTSHGEKLHQMEKKLFNALKASTEMALSNSQMDRIQSLIFESQKGMMEHIFNLNLDVESINFKESQDLLVKYIDWQIDTMKQGNHQQSSISNDERMATQSEINNERINKLEDFKQVIQEKIDEVKLVELEEIEKQEQELKAFKSKHKNSRGSVVNRRLTIAKESLEQQSWNKRRATMMGKNANYMPMIKSSTLLKNKNQNDSITEYEQEDNNNSLRETVPAQNTISAKQIKTLALKKEPGSEQEEVQQSKIMQLDSESLIVSQKKILFDDAVSNQSQKKEDEGIVGVDQQILESDQEESVKFYIEEQQFEDYKLEIQDQIRELREQQEQNSLTIQEQINAITAQTIPEIQNEIGSVRDQVQIIKDYDLEQVKIILSGQMTKAFQLVREEFFFEVTSMQENINKLYDNFKDIMNKVESEQKKMKRERADQILMLERFMKDTMAISEESNRIFEIIRNLSYIIAILVEIHNIQIATDSSQEQESPSQRQGISLENQQPQEVSVVYKGRKFQKAYLLQLKKVLLETEWGLYLGKEPFSQIFGQNNPSFYEVIIQKLNRYITDPQGYVESFLMESQFSKLAHSQHQNQYQQVKEVPQEIMKIKNVYEGSSKKKSNQVNKSMNSKNNNNASQDLLFQSSVDSVKNNNELFVEGYNEKAKKIQFEVYSKQKNNSVIGNQSSRSKSPIDQRYTPYQTKSYQSTHQQNNNNYVMMPEIIHQTSSKTRNGNHPSFSYTQQVKVSQQDFHEQLDSNISYQNNKKKEAGDLASFNRGSANSSYNIQNLDLIPRFKAPLKNSILNSKINQIVSLQQMFQFVLQPLKNDQSPNVNQESLTTQSALNKSAHFGEGNRQGTVTGYGSIIQATGKHISNELKGSLNVGKKNIIAVNTKK